MLELQNEAVLIRQLLRISSELNFYRNILSFADQQNLFLEMFEKKRFFRHYLTFDILVLKCRLMFNFE